MDLGLLRPQASLSSRKIIILRLRYVRPTRHRSHSHSLVRVKRVKHYCTLRYVLAEGFTNNWELIPTDIPLTELPHLTHRTPGPDFAQRLVFVKFASASPGKEATWLDAAAAPPAYRHRSPSSTLKDGSVVLARK